MTLKPFFLPAPTGGINARDSLATMPITDAIEMIDLYPDNDRIITLPVREITGLSSYEVSGETFAGRSLMSMTQADGTQKLLIIDLENYAVDVTTTTEVDKTGSATITSDIWHHCEFMHYLFMANGVDEPMRYDGSTLNYNGDGTLAFSGGGLTTTKLASVGQYKRRLYFLEADTSNVWYGGVEAVSGALTKFETAGVLREGGQLFIVGSTSSPNGYDVGEYWVAISEHGEVLVYQGDYPGSSTWAIVGRYKIPPPLGRRAFFYMASDLHVVTTLGIVPISAVLRRDMVGGQYRMITDKISKLYKSAVGAYTPGTYENATIRALVHPTANYLFLKIATTGVATYEYFMNITTGAWSRGNYRRVKDACLHKGTIYGTYGDNEIIFFGGTSTRLTYRNYTLRQAFTFLDDVAHKKIISMIQPIVNITGSATVKIAFDNEFQNSATTADITIGTGYNSDEFQVSHSGGRAISLKMEGRGGDVSDSLEYIGSTIFYETGDVI